MNRTLLSTASLALILTMSVPLFVFAGGKGHHDHSAQDHASTAAVTAQVEGEAPTADDAVIAEQLPTYPLSACVVSDEELGKMGEPENHVFEGRLVRLCCSMCEKQFHEDPAAYVATIDAAVVEEQLPTYSLGTCPVSGMKLGGMGEPYNHVHGTRLVRFCCGGCLERFQEDAASYIAKINEAMPEEAR